MAIDLSRIRTALAENWGMKLLALGLALFTYHAIREATGYEVLYDLRIEVENQPGIAILEQSPRTAEVTFRGSQDELRNLDPKMLKIVVRPTANNPSGTERVTLGMRNVVGAGGVNVVRVRPAAVLLTFDREDSRQVPVAQPETSGTPLLGRIQLEYEPRLVTVRGPKRMLDTVRILQAEPIDVDGRGTSFTRLARIQASASAPSLVFDPEEITVKVSIITDTITREWTNIVVAALLDPGSRGSAQVVPPTVSVSVHGHSDVLKNVTDNDIRVFADCRGLQTNGVYARTLAIFIPNQPNLTTSANPELVHVRFHTPAPDAGTNAPEPAAADPAPATTTKEEPARASQEGS